MSEPRPAPGLPVVESLRIHPVKSTAIRRLDEVRVRRHGLDGDRTWMIVGADGEALTAREAPELFGIAAEPTPDGVRLSADGHPAVEVPVPDGGEERPTLFGNPLTGRAAGEEADAWLRRVLGRDDVRLVHCHDPAARTLNPRYARPDDRAAYQDGCPVSIVSTASVRQLSEWVAELAAGEGEDAPAAVDVDRFRPNIVVDGVETAFDEDAWDRIRIGDVPFRVVERIDRCIMTLIDPATHSRDGREPLRTLAKRRRSDGGVWFCVKAIPDGEGTISVGDTVHVDSRRS